MLMMERVTKKRKLRNSRECSRDCILELRLWIPTRKGIWVHGDVWPDLTASSKIVMLMVV